MENRVSKPLLKSLKKLTISLASRDFQKLKKIFHRYFQEKKALGTAGGIFEFKDKIFDSKT